MSYASKGQVLTPLPSHKDNNISYLGEQKDLKNDFFENLPELSAQEVKETAKETVNEMKEVARQT